MYFDSCSKYVSQGHVRVPAKTQSRSYCNSREPAVYYFSFLIVPKIQFSEKTGGHGNNLLALA
jgi:hypothetical protein